MWTRCKNKLQKSLTHHLSEAKRVYWCKDHSVLDLFPILLPRYLLSLAVAAWHFFSLSGCSHFLTLLSDISTASLHQINKRKHSLICVWPRFLCFFQLPLIVYLLCFHPEENISLIPWKFSFSQPPRTTDWWRCLILQHVFKF